MRRTALAALALSGALAAPAPALAHEGDPNYESLVTRVDGVPGLTAQVLDGDDRLLLVHRGRATVVVEGYDEEPYARLRPDGTVEVNRRSPAAHLNDERFGQVDLPAEARADAEPRWEVVGRTGRFEFHDHRIHWMAETDPPQVRDRAARQKVVDWTVPLEADGRPAAVHGTLWWRGADDGPPAAAFAALGLLVCGGAAAVVVVRRRRRTAAAGGGHEREEREAW